LGYANVTTLTILEHLTTNYGTLSTDDLNNNINKLNEDWSPSDPIETIFTRIRECRTFAQYDDPITEASAVRIAIQMVERSGVFGDAIKDWRKKANAEKTLANFFTDFRAADLERSRTATTRSAGYHNRAAAATTTPAVAPTAAGRSTIPTLAYCWLHGAGNNPEHTSATCKTPTVGHRCEATWDNMLGGNNLIRRKRHEKATYVPPARKPADTPAPPS
jgi:hypothetical protein